jgi:hypothetical protein
MSPAQVAAAIVRSRQAWTWDGAPLSCRKVADVLRYQMHAGRVRRVSRGLYVFVPGSLPRTTQWRCERWERWYDELEYRPPGSIDARDSDDQFE